jgi:hypothetical protein
MDAQRQTVESDFPDGIDIGRGTYAFAPIRIRTGPQRTYDPISAESKGEGSRVPMLLAQVSRSGSNRQWESLQSL